jgi:hypothetical protein
MGRIADREGLRYVQAVSRFLRGRIAADQGRPGGFDQMHQTLVGFLAMGARGAGRRR